jgi:integrase
MRMVTITRHAELSVFRFQNRHYWYAKKWLFHEGKWGAVRSTAVPVTSPKSLAERAARSMLASGAFEKPQPERMLIPFLETFWGETYPADRKAQGRPISAAYTANCLGKIKNYIDTYIPFAGLTLDGLTVDSLEKWRTWLSGRGLTARGINICLQCVKVPVGEALRRGLIKNNPCVDVKNSAETRTEKGVLTENEARSLIGLLNAESGEPRQLAAVLLALGCGLRRGEIRGLQWADIEDGLLYVRHNYTDADGAKAPKCGSAGRVPVPVYVAEALARVPRVAGSVLVFPSLMDTDKPLSGRWFELAFYSCMDAIGITSAVQRERNLTLHGMRHSFVTLLQKAGLSLVEVSALARKRDMRDTGRRYTHGAQVVDLMAAAKRMNTLGTTIV